METCKNFGDEIFFNDKDLKRNSHVLCEHI